jgi:hypothetical protein
MNSKHTPGPWHLVLRDEATSSQAHAVAFSGSAGFDLEPWGNRAPISAADARLIAAAPEMLAHLQNLVFAEDRREGASLGAQSAAIRALLARLDDNLK